MPIFRRHPQARYDAVNDEQYDPTGLFDLAKALRANIDTLDASTLDRLNTVVGKDPELVRVYWRANRQRNQPVVPPGSDTASLVAHTAIKDIADAWRDVLVHGTNIAKTTDEITARIEKFREVIGHENPMRYDGANQPPLPAFTGTAAQELQRLAHHYYVVTAPNRQRFSSRSS